ncbi:TetR/AcrR family transcriptional regulator [Paramicrobacterium agarici]|uniref:TetR/AcrR family transcriptional regulator n=1 Tax=Paramicrobacterium agarici TaxID=630514 RepID=UPI00114EBCDB|nr:TetR/AcrR family transcriptional regulator [Microbacterium agarici]
MPTPDRTSLPAIVAAGQHILESDGLDAVTMAAVADRVGVRPPSLYKRVRNRDELIRLIAEAAVTELGAALAQADPGGDPRERLRAIVTALREFARARTAAYLLVFTPLTTEPPSRELLETSSAPLFDAVAEIVDHDNVLEAARTFTAWATGFIAMELNGSFHLGGDVDTAFAYGVERLAAAITDR